MCIVCIIYSGYTKHVCTWCTEPGAERKIRFVTSEGKDQQLVYQQEKLSDGGDKIILHLLLTLPQHAIHSLSFSCFYQMLLLLTLISFHEIS